MKKYLALAIIGITFVGLQIGIGGVGVVEVQAALSKPQLEKAVTQAAALNEIIAEKSSKHIEAITAQRDALVKTIFATDPQAALAVAREESVTGVLNIFYAEDFKRPENSRTIYKVKAGERSYTLYPSSPLEVSSGSTVKVTGAIVGDAIAAHAADIVTTKAAARPDSVGDQKTLFLLLSYLNSAPAPKTPEEIYDLTFHGQFQKFYAEQSYGKVSFSGDVRGWYQLPRNDDCAQIDVEGTEFSQLIARNNIDLSRYGRLVLVTNGPCSSYSGVSSNGKITVTVDGQQYRFSAAWISIGADSFSKSWSRDITTGANRYPFTWTVWDYILSHEMGHSLGVSHANGWDCGANVLYDANCRHVEYGNNFDAMGIGLYSLHFNAFYKELLGWMTAQDSLRITTSGRYTLTSLEGVAPPAPSPLDDNAVSAPGATTPPSTGAAMTKATLPAVPASTKKFAKVQIAGTSLLPFYVEYRKAAGFDGGLSRPDLASNQQGLFVNRVIESFARFPRLLDAQPTAAAWDLDLFQATLNKSTSATPTVFKDDQKGITIGPVISTTPTTITFDVKIDPVSCVRGGPTVTSFSAPTFMGQGASSNVQVSFKNADSYVCGSSPFTLVSNLPASWKVAVDPVEDAVLRPSTTDEPGNIGMRRLNFTVPEDAAPGPYPITVSVLNRNSGVRTDRTMTLTVNEVPVVEGIKPRIGSVESEMTVLGSRFAPPVRLGMYGTSSYAWITPTFADLNTIRFNVPSVLTSLECGCLTPTTPGSYELYVLTNTGYGAPVVFEVVAESARPDASTADNTKKKMAPSGSAIQNFSPITEVEAAETATFVDTDSVESAAPTNETDENLKLKMEETEKINLFEKGKELGAAAFSGFVLAVQTLLFE